MATINSKRLEGLAIVLVLLMLLLQCFYALFAFIDPQGFSINRGTQLFDSGDTDWVRIYASRTLFVGLIVGYLLFARDFMSLKWVALLALVMPIADGWLAYRGHADSTVVAKHVATVVYLSGAALVLHVVNKRQPRQSTQEEREM